MCHNVEMNGSDWIRLQRAKALVLGKQNTPNNRTGDYLAERRFGAAPVIVRGVEVKPCCPESASPSVTAVASDILLGGVKVGSIIFPKLSSTIVNGPFISLLSTFLKTLSSSPASLGVKASLGVNASSPLNFSEPSAVISTLVDTIKANPNFLDNAKTYIDSVFNALSPTVQEKINTDALMIISILKDENGTNQVYATLGSLRTQLGTTDYAKLVEAFSPLIYG